MAAKDIDAADWVDQDLLTRTEAGERLDEEMALVRARLRELERGSADAATGSSVEMIARRLAAMESVRNSL